MLVFIEQIWVLMSRGRRISLAETHVDICVSATMIKIRACTNCHCDERTDLIRWRVRGRFCEPITVVPSDAIIKNSMHPRCKLRDAMYMVARYCAKIARTCSSDPLMNLATDSSQARFRSAIKLIARCAETKIAIKHWMFRGYYSSRASLGRPRNKWQRNISHRCLPIELEDARLLQITIVLLVRDLNRLVLLQCTKYLQRKDKYKDEKVSLEIQISRMVKFMRHQSQNWNTRSPVFCFWRARQSEIYRHEMH